MSCVDWSSGQAWWPVGVACRDTCPVLIGPVDSHDDQLVWHVVIHVLCWLVQWTGMDSWCGMSMTSWCGMSWYMSCVDWSSGQSWWPVGVACRDTCPVLIGSVDSHDDQLVWHVVIHVLCWLVQWTVMMTSWCGMSWYMSCVDWSSGQAWWPVGMACRDTCPVLIGPVDRHDDQLVWHVVIHVLCWLVQWTVMMTSWCGMSWYMSCVDWSSGQSWWPVGVACRDTCPVLIGPVDRHDDQLVWHVVIHVLCWLVQWTVMMTSWCGMSWYMSCVDWSSGQALVHDQLVWHVVIHVLWYMSCVDWSSGQSWWPVGVACSDTCPVLIGSVDSHDDQLVWHVVIHVLCWLVQWTVMMTSWCGMSWYMSCVDWSSGQALWPVGVACSDTCPVLIGPVDSHDDQLVWHVVIHVLCWLVQWTGMKTSWCGMSWYMSCVDWSSGQLWWPVGVACSDNVMCWLVYFVCGKH